MLLAIRKNRSTNWPRSPNPIATGSIDSCAQWLELGRPLRRDVPESVWASMIFWPHLLADSWGFLADCVRAGSNKGAEEAMRRDGIKSAWSREPNVGAIFHSVFAEPGGTEMADFAAAYDFSNSKVVADLGGAGGGLLTAILQTNPHARGILVDQPQAMEGAADKFASAGLTDRCDLRPGDLKQIVPPGADIYILKAVLHGYSDEHARAILQNVRKVMSPHHRLLIIEVVLPAQVNHADERVERLLLADLNMLVATGGRERNETEWRALLRSAGFECRCVILVDQQEACIIEASPTYVDEAYHFCSAS
jgi:hypothetical protein